MGDRRLTPEERARLRGEVDAAKRARTALVGASYRPGLSEAAWLAAGGDAEKALALAVNHLQQFGAFRFPKKAG